MAFVIELAALLAAVFILYLLFKFLTNPLHILANAVIGVVLLLVINLFLVRDVAINFFSVAIVAIAGIPGVLLVLLLHFLGLGF